MLVKFNKMLATFVLMLVTFSTFAMSNKRKGGLEMSLKNDVIWLPPDFDFDSPDWHNSTTLAKPSESSKPKPDDPNVKYVNFMRPNFHMPNYGHYYGPPKWRKKDITYFFENYGSQINKEQVRQAMRNAYNEWSNIVDLKFTEVSNAQGADMKIRFGTGAHGCFDPFKGELAHSTMPTMQRTVIHVNEAHRWSPSYLQKVAIHEIGHTLGLAHTDDWNSIMFPTTTWATKPNQLDVANVRKLYPAAKNANPTQPSGAAKRSQGPSAVGSGSARPPAAYGNNGRAPNPRGNAGRSHRPGLGGTGNGGNGNGRQQNWPGRYYGSGQNGINGKRRQGNGNMKPRLTKRRHPSRRSNVRNINTDGQKAQKQSSGATATGRKQTPNGRQVKVKQRKGRQ